MILSRGILLSAYMTKPFIREEFDQIGVGKSYTCI